MEKIPILFLAAGRRVQMTQMFLERGFEVFSYESDLTSPICQVAFVIEATKPWSDSHFMDEILPVYKANNIQLVIPFQDEAVIAACKLDRYFKNRGLEPKIVCSPIAVAEICYDKLFFEQWMGDKFPTIYPSANILRPMIIKPRYGAGSRIIFHVENELDLEKYKLLISSGKWIKQRKIKGIEYSVDCYFDPDGNYIDSVPRRRILIGSSGEVVKSITERNKWLQAISKEVGERLGLIGPVNMQYILEYNTGEIYLFEINARFGGGYTLSIHAGMDVINLIARDYLGRDFEYEPDTWRNNLLLQRAYRDFYFQRPV